MTSPKRSVSLQDLINLADSSKSPLMVHHEGCGGEVLAIQPTGIMSGTDPWYSCTKCMTIWGMYNLKTASTSDLDKWFYADGTLPDGVWLLEHPDGYLYTSDKLEDAQQHPRVDPTSFSYKG